MIPIEEMSHAELYDNITRWEIPSRTDPHTKYVCELRSYGGNGECPCDDFNFRFRKHLALGITPEQALRQGIVEKLRVGQRRADALRCDHLIDAHEQFNQHHLRVYDKLSKAHPTPTQQ